MRFLDLKDVPSTYATHAGQGLKIKADESELDYSDMLPDAHASRHISGGADSIKLDDLSAPDDNTDLNASTSKHGLMPKLGNDATQFFNGQGGQTVPNHGEGYITVSPRAVHEVIQGTWAISIDTAQLYNGYFSNTTNANGDQIDYKVFLAAGTYTFRALVVLGPSCGIMDVLIDDVSQGTIDTYAAVATRNAQTNITGITVAAGGLKKLSIKVNGQNGSSTGYFLNISNMVLYRTA